MANKQISLLLKANTNLVEINREYPLLSKQASIPRHLCTNTQPLKTSGHVCIEKLPNIVACGHQGKDSNKHSKNVNEQTEVIELFPCQPEEEIKKKSYRKCRYQLPNSNDGDDDERDNRN